MTSRARRLTLVLLVAMLLASACGDDDDDGVATTETTDEARTRTTNERRDRKPDADAETALHVEPDGLRIEEALPFGTPRDDVVPAVRDILGRPSDRGSQEDCLAGETSFVRFDEPPGDLVLNLQNGALAGWSIGEDSRLKTSAGIGIGSTKAELEAAYGPVVMVPDSTIGIEFFIEGGLSGLLVADAPDGAITSLWAGINCIAR
jgi:hypothetical protein